MTPPIRISPRAAHDLDGFAEYLGERSSQAAVRFQSAVEKTLKFLQEFPEIGSTYTKTDPVPQELRWWPVRRFKNYLIFYRLLAEHLEVVRVLYGSRDLESILDSETKG